MRKTYPAIFIVTQPSWLWGGQASCLTNLSNPAGETPACLTGWKPALPSPPAAAEDSAKQAASDLAAELAARSAHRALGH
jgi:hypothetical protein